ncbi:unnamed protein product [Phytophthora fragariaefolia]|uniref:Unnamed protein product n=1 Tax=Phytophthora fragariaefolia TaxID=1490495 RepID=A0A9W7D551_9STRA|nr:unnamed protein product [Phytophthora fragariaefolia]
MAASQTSDKMNSLEMSHIRRMDELNRIAVDHLGDRISNLDEDMLGSAFKPGRSLNPNQFEEGEGIQWRSSDLMLEAETKHAEDMERLRRRIRQLEEECRESIASVLTVDEMDLSELDGDDFTNSGFNGHQSLNGGKSFNPQSSFMSASDLSASVISEQEEEEPMPARVLLEQIAKLTQLQQDMSEADAADDEEYRERVKTQYRVLRSIETETQRERLSSSLSEENWI